MIFEFHTKYPDYPMYGDYQPKYLPGMWKEEPKLAADQDPAVISQFPRLDPDEPVIYIQHFLDISGRQSHFTVPDKDMKGNLVRLLRRYLEGDAEKDKHFRDWVYEVDNIGLFNCSKEWSAGTKRYLKDKKKNGKPGRHTRFKTLIETLEQHLDEPYVWAEVGYTNAAYRRRLEYADHNGISFAAGLVEAIAYVEYGNKIQGEMTYGWFYQPVLRCRNIEDAPLFEVCPVYIIALRIILIMPCTNVM